MLHRQFQKDSCRRGRSVGRGRIQKQSEPGTVYYGGWTAKLTQNATSELQHIISRKGFMENAYSINGWDFILKETSNSIYYYDIVSLSGQKYYYEHAFSSYAEIVDFVNDHII